MKITAEISTDKKISANISDVKIISGDSELYAGEYTVTPKANESTKLQTKDKLMADDVSILEIPYYDVSNESGTTIFIASEVNKNGN